MNSKILIIDDEELICEGLSRILKEKGYLVDFTMDGFKAFQMIKIKEYDLILLDINLPKKSGLKLLPEIKLASPGSLVIIITAYSDIYMAVKAIKAGAYDYCVKSIDCEDLLIKIEQALQVLKL